MEIANPARALSANWLTRNFPGGVGGGSKSHRNQHRQEKSLHLREPRRQGISLQSALASKSVTIPPKIVPGNPAPALETWEIENRNGGS